MKRSVSIGVILSAVVCLAYGCGGDDDTTSSTPHAGSAGKGGGSGGKGGAGGSSAKGGTAGVSGGRGGTAGAPHGGTSGRGGTAGVSGAGQGGQCEAEPSGPLAEDCATVGTSGGDQSTVQTTCSFEDTCRELHCGDTWSQFDASGCRRPTCGASSQCDDDERCVSSLLVGNFDCFPSLVEGCELDGCSCGCIATEDCVMLSLCLPPDDFPEAADCPLSTIGCVSLPSYIDALGRWTDGIDTDDPSDLDAALLDCQHKAEQKLDACPGHGGEGGGGAGGQSGGGAGGQSGGGQSGGGIGGQ